MKVLSQRTISVSSSGGNVDYDRYDDEQDQENLDDESSLELRSGLSFPNWESFKVWIDRFARLKGFGYKIRTSESNNGIMRRATYVCTKSGTR